MSSGTTVQVPEAVMERVHAELVSAFTKSPDYINKIVDELLRQPGSYNSRGSDGEDYTRPLFERLLRRELHTLVEASMRKALREKYSTAVDEAVAVSVARMEAVEGSLAHAFSQMLNSEWRAHIDVKFALRQQV